MDILVALWSHSSSRLAQTTTEKLGHLTSAVQTVAAKLPTGSPDQPIVGIFVAPEYAFNKQRAQENDPRSLEEDEKNQILAQLIALSVNHPKLLIVPGSIAWRKPITRPDEQKNKKDPTTGLRTGPEKTQSRYDKISNTYASIDLPMSITHMAEETRSIGGTSDTIPSAVDKVNKAYASHLVGTGYMQRNTAYVLLGGSIKYKYNKMADYHEAIGEQGDTVFIPGGRLGRFELHNIRFAIEICRDHAFGVAHDTVGAFDPKPHVHIVLSDWVENYDDKIVLEPGGWFAHASTNTAKTCVKHKDLTSGAIADRTADTGTDTVDGATVNYWTITLDDSLLPQAQIPQLTDEQLEAFLNDMMANPDAFADFLLPLDTTSGLTAPSTPQPSSLGLGQNVGSTSNGTLQNTTSLTSIQGSSMPIATTTQPDPLAFLGGPSSPSNLFAPSSPSMAFFGSTSGPSNLFAPSSPGLSFLGGPPSPLDFSTPGTPDMSMLQNFLGGLQSENIGVELMQEALVRNKRRGSWDSTKGKDDENKKKRRDFL